MTNRRVYDNAGNLIRSEIADYGTGKLVVTDHEDGDAVTEVDLTADQIQGKTYKDQEARLAARFQDLKDAPRLVPADFPAAQRELVRQHNDLMAVCKILVRKVNNLEAEDDD